MIRLMILTVAVLSLGPAALSAPTKNRPHILTETQYQCLMRHRTKMRAIGGDGTWFDLSSCPNKPVAVKGVYVPAPSEKYIQLSKSDLECLGRKEKNVAVRRSDKQVEIYLSPCGAG